MNFELGVLETVAQHETFFMSKGKVKCVPQSSWVILLFPFHVVCENPTQMSISNIPGCHDKEEGLSLLRPINEYDFLELNGNSISITDF